MSFAGGVGRETESFLILLSLLLGAVSVFPADARAASSAPAVSTAAFTAAAVDLSAARAYPVPYKPNGVNPNEGKPFAPGDPTSGILFDRLSAGASIKIFAPGGRKVAELSAGPAGSAQWNAKDDGGRDAASGAYFAVISAPGTKSVVRKLLIIR
jgi:hypothetical protein